MPKLPDQPNVLKIDHVFSVGSDNTVIVRTYYTYTGSAPNAAALGTIANSIATAALAHIVQLMYPGNAFERIDITDLTTPSSAFGTGGSRTAGLRTGDTLAASSCALQNFEINRRYRGGKPRAYWPFGTATDLVTAQTWNGAALSAFQTQTDAYLAAIKGQSAGGCTIAEHVNISYYSGFTAVENPVTGRTKDVPKVRTTAIAPDVIVGTAFNPKVGTQRRRINA